MVTSLDYLKAAVAIVEKSVKITTRQFPNKVLMPMVLSYLTVLDASKELKPDNIQFFQELIGMLRWATEVGRVEVMLETSLLLKYQ